VNDNRTFSNYSTKVITQIGISILTAAVAWVQIALLSRTLDTENLSVFLVSWSIFGYVSLSLFAAQDSIILSSKRQLGENEVYETQRSRFLKSKYVNSYNLAIWTLFSGVMLLAIPSKIALVALSALAALSQIPVQKIVKSKGGPSALNQLFFSISIIRILAIIAFVLIVPDQKLLINMIFLMILSINVISFLKLDTASREVSMFDIRLDVGILSKVSLFWGLLYFDTIFVRLYMPANDAAVYSIISLLIKGFLVMQILPLNYAVIKFSSQVRKHSVAFQVCHNYLPFILMWSIFSLLILHFQNNLIQLLLNRSYSPENNYALIALLYHATFPIMFVLLERSKQLKPKFTLLVFFALVITLWLGNFLKLSEHFFFLTTGAFQAFVIASLIYLRLRASSL
jgi:hypothetical protein